VGVVDMVYPLTNGPGNMDWKYGLRGAAKVIGEYSSG
jgi:hypothetical protein